MNRVTTLLLLLFLLSPHVSFGSEQPLETLRTSIDSVLNVLGDPTYQDPSRESEQQEKIWTIFKQIFDFEEMSKRTLSNNWRSLTAQEQEEFSDVFGKFLGNIYLGKIQKGFDGEKVEYLNQETLTETKAMIKTTILRKGVEVPIDYSLLLKDNTWKIYDVKIEGISLLKNYRSQFGSILMKNSPEYLINTLKKKIED